jgi:hypothetical protein
MKYLLLLLAVATTLLAFSPGSFRLQSTSGIWEDDYDLIFDPGRLTLIDGQRVYSNLSNYVTSDEGVFGPNSSNFILVGASGHLKSKLAPAALFDGHNFRTPEFTGLLSADSGDSTFGSGRATDVSWLDLDSNGVYDFKRVRETERNAWRSGSGNDLFVGAGWLSGSRRFGVALAWSESGTKQVLPGLDFTDHDYDSTLITGGLTYLLNDTSRYYSLACANSGSLVLSCWSDQKNGAMLGVSLSPGLLADDASFEQTLSSYADHAPADPAVTDFARRSVDNSSRLSYQGFQVPLNFTLVRPKGKSGQSWLYAQGFYRAEFLASDAGSHDITSFEQTLNPGDSAGFDSIVRAFSGLQSSFGGSIRMKELYEVGERLNVGWSVQLGARWYSDTLADDMNERGSVRFDDGDSVQSSADYVQSITGSERWMNRLVGREAMLIVPVGLEFKIVPRVAFRLGARHTVTWDDHVTTRQLLSWAPRKIRTDFGDGTFSEQIDTLGRRVASSEDRVGFTQATVFSYGAGLRPIDNLQIDLMGFANLVNLTGWRLAATLRF